MNEVIAGQELAVGDRVNDDLVWGITAAKKDLEGCFEAGRAVTGFS